MMRREREVTRLCDKLDILRRGKVLHLGLCDGDQPYVVPMCYGFVCGEDERLRLYLHGARKGYKYEVLARNPKVSFALECDVAPFEGDVACRYGMSYASVMGRGVARLVKDPAEKCEALRRIMQVQSGKDFDFTEALAAVVNVVRVDVDEWTAKRRPLPAREPSSSHE